MTRVAVVGAGKMGALHARVFAACAKLAGVFDIDRAASSALAMRHDTKCCGSIDEAIERAELVIVATPTAHHFADASRAITAGRHVLVEKPLCRSSAEARALSELATAHGVRLLVGHSERFNAVIRALVRLTDGDPIERCTTRRAAAGDADDMILNLAVHDIDLAALLMRAPVDLAEASGDSSSAEIVVRCGDSRANINVARRANRERTISLQTAHSSYHGDLLVPELRRGDELIALDHHEPLALQAKAALAALAGEPSEIATGTDGRIAVDIAERATLQIADLVSAAE